LSVEQGAELRALVNSPSVPATIATRARIVLWRAEGRRKKEVAELAGMSRPTVDLWLARYGTGGVAGLTDRSHAAPREQVPASIRGRILALSRISPPAETGLSHWSSREMAAFIARTEGVSVSHHYVAKLWRENRLAPHQHGTFKLSKDPAFAEKVADVVGLYLEPPGGAVVLSVDEKTGVQALDRTQPLLPIDFDATEKRTHDYVRHGTITRAEREAKALRGANADAVIGKLTRSSPDGPPTIGSGCPNGRSTRWTLTCGGWSTSGPGSLMRLSRSAG
jgi:transposase